MEGNEWGVGDIYNGFLEIEKYNNDNEKLKKKSLESKGLYMFLNICFQFLNNIIHIFTYIFHSYIFQKNTNNIIKTTFPKNATWYYDPIWLDN